MTKATYIQEGDCIDYTNQGAATIEYLDVVPLSRRIGVAQSAIDPGDTGTLCTCGVFELPAVNDTAFAVDDKIFWDTAAGKLTKVEAGNTVAGWCVAPKELAGVTARVNIEVGA